MWMVLGLLAVVGVLLGWVVHVRRQGRLVDQVSQAWLAEHVRERGKQS